MICGFNIIEKKGRQKSKSFKIRKIINLFYSIRKEAGHTVSSVKQINHDTFEMKVFKLIKTNEKNNITIRKKDDNASKR